MSEQPSAMRMRMDIMAEEQQEGRVGPGGMGMCRSNQNVWLSGSRVLHSHSHVKKILSFGLF